MFGSEFESCRRKVDEIDRWLENYEGDDEGLINRKLDEQDKCLDFMRKQREAHIRSQR